MGAALDDGDDAEITSINVTPLVDITLVLLIIFMVTTSVITNPEGIQIDKPDAATGKQMEQSRLVVKCLEDNKILVEDEEMPDDAALTAAVKEAVGENPEVQGIVLCDTKAEAGTLMHIIDVMRDSGVKKYGVATEKPKAESASG